MVRYRYTPLPGNNYIRLATIHPGKFEDDIVVSFRTVPFPGPTYEALSYAWGSKKNPRSVYVSKCDAGTTAALQKICKIKLESIPTTQNLDIALRHLRYVVDPRVIWIDALCIHQADAAEKGRQVAMMGDIYRLAHRVIAWLGPEENDSNNAMALMRLLGLQVEISKSFAMSAAEGSIDPSFSDRRVLLPLDQRDLRSVYHLISRQWFERLWVRQEIHLANLNASFLCGFRQVEWSIFKRALFCIYWKRKIGFEYFKKFANRLQSISGLFWFNGFTTILDLRSRYGYCQCLNPLDRLYAVLAVLPEDERAIIPSPDYTISHAELYTNVTERWINCIKNLDILGQCHIQDDGPCPSWVPDWSRPTSFAQTTSLTTAVWQRASSQLASWHEFLQPGVLRITGISRETVQQHYQIPSLIGRTEKFGLEEIRRLLLELDPGKRLTTESIARLFLGRSFSGDFDPPTNIGMDFNEAKQFLELMLSDNYNDDFTVSPVGLIFLGSVASAISGLQLVQTTGGHIGIASNSVRTGDNICCALGCATPLLLRPLESGMFKVVGPCLVPDFTNGKVFLGPLPENFRSVQVYNEAADNYEPGFKDAFSGETTYEDPRLKSLSLDTSYLDSFREQLYKDHLARIYVDPEILRRRGVELRYFDLV